MINKEKVTSQFWALEVLDQGAGTRCLVSDEVLAMSSQGTGGYGPLGSRALLAEGCHRGLASVEIL